MIPFKVGDQVVCIDAKVGFEQFIEIKEGEVYTISWIGPFEHYTQGSYIGVRLKGVDRGICPQFGYDNPPFAARRVRDTRGSQVPAASTSHRRPAGRVWTGSPSRPGRWRSTSPPTSPGQPTSTRSGVPTLR